MRDRLIPLTPATRIGKPYRMRPTLWLLSYRRPGPVTGPTEYPAKIVKYRSRKVLVVITKRGITLGIGRHGWAIGWLRTSG